MQTDPRRIFTCHRVMRFVAFCVALAACSAGAAQMDIPGPPGSVSFGRFVAVLPNGNVVVVDDQASNGAVANAGAVYLYSPERALISVVRGSNTDDRVGINGITVLSNGNFLVGSPQWNNYRGAVTWVDGGSGLSGTVSSANSLVGSTTGDAIGADTFSTVHTLSNGNYVVVSQNWSNGANAAAGAATWGNGSTGTSGVVSVSNSLVGTSANDRVGNSGVTALSNGNYVVSSTWWTNQGMARAGAATWGNGSVGTSGEVSSLNSLVGSTAWDRVGEQDVVALPNGNYVVVSPFWTLGSIQAVGAVTWGNGSTGTAGAISSVNSMVGSSQNDYVGGRGVYPLTNDNYVIASPNWSNGAVKYVGAVTWCNGSAPASGAISPGNSLIGGTTWDMVSSGSDTGGIVALNNGNYVVNSPSWTNGFDEDVGAVTWVNGSSAIVGTVTAAMSLIGTRRDDLQYAEVAALSNGNYVIGSAQWDNGTIQQAGAATWANGTTGLVGIVSTANSLVGTSAYDGVHHVVPLRGNGNYVVQSSWHDGTGNLVGSVTWANGSTGRVGTVSAANSLVGTQHMDRVGDYVVVPLDDGNYVVPSSNWDNANLVDAGAVTWGNGAFGITGAVSSANSLVGSSAGDRLGSQRIEGQANGDYLVVGSRWDNGPIVDAGMATVGHRGTPLTGIVDPARSIRGTVTNPLGVLVSAGYNATRNLMVLGQPSANLVSFLWTDGLFAHGFE